MSNQKIPIILAAVAVAVLVLFYVFGGDGRTYGWAEHYRPNSKDPYGTYLVHELLKEYFPGGHLEVMRDSLAEPSPDSLGNYIFIGNSLWLDSAKMNRLLHFVEVGNDAFIASKYIQEDLLDSITGRECTDLTYLLDSLYEYDDPGYYFQDSTVDLNLLHSKLRGEVEYDFTYLISNRKEDYVWDYLPSDLFCEERTNLVSLGQINDSETNFAKAKFGKGHFFLHTTPIAFTNLHLLDTLGREYAERVLSHLEARPIYWDGIRRNGRGDGGNGGRASFGESPLRYILSQPALKWAWYTLLAMALLYLVFNAKRRQRIIPVLEKNENTSLEFISTIGRLHFIQNNHRQLALQKMRLFLGYVRDRYHLSTKEVNESFEKQLTARSEVPEMVVGKIFTIHRNIESSSYVSENVLIDFHRVMAEFYQKCK